MVRASPADTSCNFRIVPACHGTSRIWVFASHGTATVPLDSERAFGTFPAINNLTVSRNVTCLPYAMQFYVNSGSQREQFTDRNKSKFGPSIQDLVGPSMARHTSQSVVLCGLLFSVAGVSVASAALSLGTQRIDICDCHCDGRSDRNSFWFAHSPLVSSREFLGPCSAGGEPGIT